jgi:uncharacterized protein YbbK (DUF523 family)
MIIVSACLAGIRSRYDGNSNFDENVSRLVLEGHAIPLCPEQHGDLETPRNPCEICPENGKVMDSSGIDRTEGFQAGANETVRLAELWGVKCALLQERSPSCGVHRIYDGTFSGRLVPGMGITARKFKNAGIAVYSLNEMGKALACSEVNFT